MDTEITDAVTDWQTVPVGDGYTGLHDLADEEFTGAVAAGLTWAFLLNGRVVGVFDGSIEDFEDASMTAYRAPEPALALLYAMQEIGGDVRAQYYTKDTSVAEADRTLSAGSFTGYLELSENVLSGDYYVVYYGGRAMPVAHVGASNRLVTDDEAFDLADDEVGIYEIYEVPIEVVDVPEPAGGDATTGDATAGGASSLRDTGLDDAEAATDTGFGHQETGEAGEAGEADDTGGRGSDDATGVTETPDVTFGAEAGEATRGGDTESTPSEGADDETPDEPTNGDENDTPLAGMDALEDSAAPETDSTVSTGSSESENGDDDSDVRPGDAGDGPRDAGGVADESRSAADGDDGGVDETELEGAESDDAGSLDDDEDTAVTSDVEEDSGVAGDSGVTGDSGVAGDSGVEGDSDVDGDGDATASGTSHPASTPPATQRATSQTEDADSGSETRQAERTIPALDPAESGSETEASRGDDSTDLDADTATGDGSETASRSESESETEATGPGVDVGALRDSLESARKNLEAVTEERDRLRHRVDSLESELEQVTGQRETYRERVAELEAEVQNLRGEVEALESQSAEGGASEAGPEQLSSTAAKSGTNLFVRYRSKGKPTLEKARSGEVEQERVVENLRLEYHTTFENESVTVDGRPYEEFLESTAEWGFVRWVVEDLLYEIGRSGNRNELDELFDRIPDVDRIQFSGEVPVTIEEDGETRHGAEEFDLVFWDSMGDPLFVADFNTGRSETTQSMVSSLVQSARRVGESKDTLGAAFFVTASFFEPGALEAVSEATGGGFLSRSSRKSFVRVSRKQGYHLCLVETRGGEFHLTVPEL